MEDCPKCLSSSRVKAGKKGDKQRYKCKDCGYHYSVEFRKSTSTLSIRKQALELYLEGLGFRSIGRILGFSHVSIYRWIREFGEKLDEIESKDKIKVVKIDEMHSFVGSKKTVLDLDCR